MVWCDLRIDSKRLKAKSSTSVHSVSLGNDANCRLHEGTNRRENKLHHREILSMAMVWCALRIGSK